MNSLSLIPLNIFEGQQLKATIFLGGVGVLLLIALVALFLSLRAQKRYDTEVLPSLPGMDDYEEEVVAPKEEEASAFQLDGDEELHTMGDREAVDLFKEMRAASTPATKKKKSGLFGKKS